MTNEHRHTLRIIIISVFALLLFVGIILYMSLVGFKYSKQANKTEKPKQTISENAQPGKQNKEVDKKITPTELAGYYIDNSDGWYYSLEYAPSEKYDGNFSAGFDKEHEAASQNPQKDYTAGGTWKLENGEIKLYSEDQYRSSLWACGNNIVDSLNYFVGNVPKNQKSFEAVCKFSAKDSGDTQIMSFYKDGKFIMEIIKNNADSAADSAASSESAEHQLFAGTYTVHDEIISTTLNGVAQDFHVVDDGMAKWVYVKK